MADIRTLDARIQPFARAIFDYARARGFNPRITSARRGFTEQGRLHRLAQMGRLAGYAAPPGLSLHQYGLAFDMVVNTPQQQAELGRLWVKGFSAGERERMRFAWYPHDPIHFEAFPRA